ncbi:hypothetical protein BC829DRAFT_37829 [Chytridium lagenaria]|nr:hypothetical protein BC829DRAFT_37829 [Chytridium lagenaria]
MSDLFRGMASKVRFNAGSSGHINATMVNTLKALEQRLASVEKRATPGTSPVRKPLINYAFTSFEESLPALVTDRTFMDKFVKAVAEFAIEDYRSLDPDFAPPSRPEILAFEAKMTDYRRDPDQFRRNMARSMPPTSTFKGGWTNRSRDNSVEPPRFAPATANATPVAPTPVILPSSQDRSSLQLPAGQTESMFICPLHRTHALDVCPDHQRAYALFSELSGIPLK